MRTRSPSPADRARLIEIISEGAVFRPEEVSCAIELLDGALAQAEGNTYEALVALADEDARPIGYACFGATPMTEGTFDLYWLVIATEARGRGLGQALVGAVEDHLRARGVRLIRVETSSLEGQGGAARFYARAGYRQVGLIAGFYRHGDDLITFAKEL
jgi:ribosomal protein S18 acetylase RimI-like enzyme